jgi:hypothetical protein
MAQNNRNFTAKQCWVVMKYLSPKRTLGQKKFTMIILFTLGEKCPSYSTAMNWIARFRTGNLSTEN